MAYTFTPQEDISPYELAQILPILVIAWQEQGAILHQILTSKTLPENNNVERAIANLPAELSRHFKQIQSSENVSRSIQV